jgi:hypothetical protein
VAAVEVLRQKAREHELNAEDLNERGELARPRARPDETSPSMGLCVAGLAFPEQPTFFVPNFVPG